MRRHAKASSAGSNSGNGKGRALFGRAAATRGASRDGEGSGAPTTRGNRLLSLLAASALLVAVVIGVNAAQAAWTSTPSKNIVGSVGAAAAGPLGGQFNQPRGIAVNESTGDFYVADDSDNRIDRFNSSGNFVSAWGRGVVTGGATGTGALTSGSATISSVLTTSKAFAVGQTITGTGIPASTTITAVGAGTITLSQPATASGAGTALTVAAGAGNNPTNEQQTVTIAATGGTFTLTVTTPNPSNTTATATAIPFNATAAAVQTKLEGLANVGAGNVAVTGAAGGPYTVEFQGTRFADTNVTQMTANAAGLTGGLHTATIATIREGAGVETCTVAAECATGIGGSNVNDHPGGELFRPGGVGVNQSGTGGAAAGDVFVRERDNRRVGVFSSSGAFKYAFGVGVVKPGGAGNVPQNEQQTVTVVATGGTFTLTFGGQTTSALAFNAEASTVQTALENLLTIGAGNVTVSGAAGGPWTVEFVGVNADANVAQMTGSATNLAGPTKTVTLATLQDGGAAYEKCTVSVDCMQSVGGGTAGAIASSGNTYAGLTINQTTGDVFILDQTNQRINQYTASGGFVRSFGFGVDTGAAQLEICTTASTCQVGIGFTEPSFNGDGAPGNGQLSGTNSNDIAIDSSNGTLYMSGLPGSAGTGYVMRYDTTQSSASSLALPLTITSASPKQSYVNAGWPATGVLGAGTPQGLQVLPNGHLLMVNQASSGADTTKVVEFNTPAAGIPSVVTNHMDTGVTTNSTGKGIGVDNTRDRLYVSTQEAGIGHRVLIVGAGSAPPPTLNLNPPSEITAHGATFTGTITPNGPGGINTLYRVEVSKNGVDWIPLPNATGVNIGDGNTPVNISQSITGLQANFLYRVRIVAQKGLGVGTTTSPQTTFLTNRVGPEVTTVYPQGVTETTARIAGYVNANNLPTSYHFEYGKTLSYERGSVPVPAGSIEGNSPEKVLADIDGLFRGQTYHYRLVATNDEGTTVGNDVTFTTPGDISEPPAGSPPGRAYEMVTPPFKATRSVVAIGAKPHLNPSTAQPSLDGDAVLWGSAFLPLTDDVGAPGSTDYRVIRRTPNGWVAQTLNTLKIDSALGGEPTGTQMHVLSHSGDLRTVSWVNWAGKMGSFLPTPEGSIRNVLYTRRDGTGTKGFTGWLTNVDAQVVGQGFDFNNSIGDVPVFNDDGSAMARWATYYRGLAEDPSLPGHEDPSSTQQRPGNPGGAAPYIQRAGDPDDMPTAPKDLISACTGAGGSATQLPTRNDNGTVGIFNAGDDYIDVRPCEQGGGGAGVATGTGTLSNASNSVTSVVTSTGSFAVGQIVSGAGIPLGTQITAISGATMTLSANATASASGVALSADVQHLTSVLGAAVGAGQEGQPVATAMSNDGNRVFFASPDPAAGPTTCASPGFAPEEGAGIGALTSCPPQLFVRQYDSSGNATVRWISRSQGIGQQLVAELGAGVVFQGASRDGRYVYFKTNAPLTSNDPNSGTSITTGSASSSSWDLYRYALPASLNADPATGSLTRITAGPLGTADPNGDGNGSNQNHAMLRYLSDDGKRAYITTNAPIAGAKNTSPTGGVTTPGGTATNAEGFRNVYLYDDTGSSPTWTFISRIPAGTTSIGGTSQANDCAAKGASIAPVLQRDGVGGLLLSNSNCWRGTPSGSSVIFQTGARLTADDDDNAADIYLYDSTTSQLIRVTAPPSDAASYVCDVDYPSGAPRSYCNGDLGAGTGQFVSSGVGGETGRGWGGNRYTNMAEDADGQVSVFFESRSQLVPGDTNGEDWDVYQWRGGELSLVSPGNLPGDSFYSGNSVDGRDVFIDTAVRIDPREIDDADYDIYDVRIGGGFPYTPPATPCDVLAHECRGPASTSPAGVAAATGSAVSSGNVTTPTCPAGQKPRGEKCVKTKAKKKKSATKGKKRTKSSQQRSGK